MKASPKKWVILLVLASAATGLWWVSGTGQVKEYGPMVQMLDDDGFVLVWHRQGSQSATVRVRGDADAPVFVQSFRPQEGRYEAAIEGLVAGSVYTYEIIPVDGGDSDEPWVRGEVMTSPVAERSFRFLAFGDSGDGREIQYRLAELMPAHHPHLVIHTGDLVFPDGAAEDYPEKFWQPYHELLKGVAFYPCAGNHDFNDFGSGPLFDTFVLPENGPKELIAERHYWFDYGNVRFVCIDTNETFDNLRDHVVPWLDRILAEADAKGMWKVAFYHFPAYPNGKYPPSGKLHTLIIPMFDRHHVHVAFNGHNHMYERSHPMRHERPVEPGQGTVYVTTAAGGNPLYDIDQPVPYYIAVQDNSQHSFTVVDVTPDELKIRQIAIDKTVMDAFSIPRRQEP